MGGGGHLPPSKRNTGKNIIINIKSVSDKDITSILKWVNQLEVQLVNTDVISIPSLGNK
jgi:hypothetical protein